MKNLIKPLITLLSCLLFAACTGLKGGGIDNTAWKTIKGEYHNSPQGETDSLLLWDILTGKPSADTSAVVSLSAGERGRMRVELWRDDSLLQTKPLKIKMKGEKFQTQKRRRGGGVPFIYYRSSSEQCLISPQGETLYVRYRQSSYGNIFIISAGSNWDTELTYGRAGD